MPVIISGIISPLEQKQYDVIAMALKSVCVISADTLFCEIYKTSLDARRQNDIHFVHSVIFELKDKLSEKAICNKYACCSLVESGGLSPVISNIKKDGEVIVVGFGPAGMFAGLILAEYGYRPVIFERGQPVDERIESVNAFWNGGILNESSNVQFGEGGAGTFSDGKLTTRISDPLCRVVLERLVEFGAPRDILFKAKPHIGTDNLRKIVKAVRNRIITLGGKVYFNSPVDDITICGGKISSVNSLGHSVQAKAAVLAVGHSARDTFEMLIFRNIHIESKPFSVGARIEHLQEDVNFSLYGKSMSNPLLPKGEYQLSHRSPDGRCVYSFCMCPGGFVVPSSSESESIVTNGMSEYSRSGKNANAALVVSVSKDDFGSAPLGGVDFARAIERQAYISSGRNYSAPAMTVGAFLGDRKTHSFQKVLPTYSVGVEEVDLNTVLPTQISSMMKIGIRNFSRRMKCFSDSSAILTAPETRTSSPVRILRNEVRESVSTENLFPCGEGAGYAGGIMSAAVDGIKTALKIMEKFAP